ncbi:MAG: rhodanese-related sulfurtransferase [Pseudomonadota bacterium]
MIKVAALYRFARFDDPAAIREPLLALCQGEGVKGTLLLAREGINGTIAGAPDAVDRVVAHIRALPGCDELELKFSHAETTPFHRLKVRLKREIVTMGEPDIDPLRGVGTYVAPTDWNALIEQPGTLVIDTRNDYEIAIGTFSGAVDPATKSFSDFPTWVREHRDALAAAPRIAMFCTGGIRCEKATAFLKAEGLAEVYHLSGGILKYLEEVPADQSRWEGECFVFDERVAVGHGLAIGRHELCRACRMPISPDDRASPLYVEGVSCPACHATRDEQQRAGYAERHRQERLAAARGEAHIGAAR